MFGVYFAISELYIMSLDLLSIYGILYDVKIMCAKSIIKKDVCVCIFLMYFIEL